MKKKETPREMLERLRQAKKEREEKNQKQSDNASWSWVLYVVLGVICFMVAVFVANSHDQKEFPMVKNMMKQNQTK